MKIDALKKIISEVVKTAVREEFRDIIIEAIKKPNNVSSAPMVEQIQPVVPFTNQQPVTEGAPFKTMEEKRAMYEGILNNTSDGMQQAQRPPSPGYVPATNDPVSGDLGRGEVSMEQITNLIQSK